MLAGESPEVLDLLRRVDPFIQLKLLSRTYPYNSKLPSILANLGEPAPDSGLGHAEFARGSRKTAGLGHGLEAAAHVDAVVAVADRLVEGGQLAGVLSDGRGGRRDQAL